MLHLVGKTWRRWLAVGDKSSELSVAERGLSLLMSKKKYKLFLLSYRKLDLQKEQGKQCSTVFGIPLKFISVPGKIMH